MLVVHGADGLDEVTTTDATYVAEAHAGRFSEYQITPEAYGLERVRLEELVCSATPDNVRIVTEILAGEKGPRRDIVILNAGCAIYAADKAKNILEGMRMAAESIDSGRARRKLELLKEYSTQ